MRAVEHFSSGSQPFVLTRQTLLFPRQCVEEPQVLPAAGKIEAIMRPGSFAGFPQKHNRLH